jgi:hypothetical protein
VNCPQIQRAGESLNRIASQGLSISPRYFCCNLRRSRREVRFT